MAAEKIIVQRLAHMVYQHPDLPKALGFFEDFGLINESTEQGRTYLRGYGSQPYCYVAEQSPDTERHFIGAYYVVKSHSELEKAAKHPGASEIRDNPGPGGGKVVELKDPFTGFIVGFVYGQTLRADVKTTDLDMEVKSEPANLALEKPRKGPQRRFREGPSPVHKLGHYGIVVPPELYEKTLDWYLSTINLAPTDSIYIPQTGKDVTCFCHIDLGEEYTDHHTFFLAMDPSGAAPHPHHCSFEVNDFDSEHVGHEHLLSKGWTNVWGIGRHLLGSQIFDYWFDASGFIVEHYSDGDLVNKDVPPVRNAAAKNTLAVWGPNVPLGFNNASIQYEPRLVAAPDVVQSIPAQVEVRA